MEMNDVFKQLEENYFMLKKRAFWYFIGGAFAFMVAAFSISYRTIMTTIENKTGEAAMQKLDSRISMADSIIEAYSRKISSINNDLLNGLPKGTILGWNNDFIPEGWAICNGEGGTPDLKERFPLGTSSFDKLRKKIGANVHSHQIKGTTSFETKRRDKRDGNGMMGSGDNCMFHTHELDFLSGESPNIPASTYIIFIIKV